MGYWPRTCSLFPQGYLYLIMALGIPSLDLSASIPFLFKALCNQKNDCLDFFNQSSQEKQADGTSFEL